MKRIFIAYRHDDTKDWVHRLGSSLAKLFLRDKVFFDIAIPPGANFVAAIDAQLARCDVALVVIGPKWFGTDNSKERRIDAPNDFVRLEVERLIARNVPIIPLLIRGAQTPSAAELPQSLVSLAELQAVPVPDESDGASIHIVVDALLQVLRKWKHMEIRSSTQAVWAHSWFDTAWLTETEGWLCGAIDMGGGGGHVGHGILLRTTDAGASWHRATNILAGRGEFSWGGYKWNWTEVGPITSMLISPRQRTEDEEIVNGYLATWTGIYRAAARRADFTHEVEWQRSTPLPDGKRPHAMFSSLVGIEGDNELYASGWLGITNWPRNTEWKLQKEAFTYDIGMVANAGGSDNRNVWAAGRTGDDGFGNWGSASRGALYHLDWPANHWQQVEWPEIQLEERQSLTGVWVEDQSHVFAVGDHGLFIRGVRQGGRVWTWQRLPVPSVSSLRRVLKNELGLWVIGDRGTILHSVDNGDHWTILDVPDVEVSLNNIRFRGSKGWIVGEHVVLCIDT